MLQNKIEWLRKNVFPEAVRAQSFGADVKDFVSFEPNHKKATDQFCSDVVFGDVTVKKENGQLVTETVVIKFQPSNKIMRKTFDCDGQFHNEILFYTTIIPLFRKYDTDNVLTKNFCEFVYRKTTNGENPDEDVIILKSLDEKGFKLTDENVFIDENHITLALDKLAKFHALSLKCQSDDPAGFNNIVSQIKNAQRELDEKLWPKNLLANCASRGIDYLKSDPKYKDRLSEISKQCQEADTWYKKAKEPSGPLNVITHSDFTRNNMMFKYGSNGEPLEVVFFDMATIKYSSPTIDTSLFLFLSTTPEVRQRHWDDFLQTYYDSLTRHLDGHPAKLSLRDVELDLRKNGVYGYYMCSTFLPAKLGAVTKEFFDDKSNVDNFVQNVNELGGSKATEYLAAIVKDMLDMNFVFEL